MQIHIEKRVVYNYHYYVQVDDELKELMPSWDFSNTENWTKKDWEDFWEQVEDLDYGAQEEMIQEDEELGSYEEIVSLWTEDK